jgi:hypothetical protein
MIDPFVFIVAEDMEEGKDYGPGGLFPVKLVTFSAQKGLCHGIGYPPNWATAPKYSTVWLARDLVARYVMGKKSQ